MDPIISVFQKVLQKAREIQVSDIHLSVGSPWKYRQHGHVIGIKSLPPLKVAEADVIVRHIISQSHTVPEEEVEKAAKELQDFDCSYSLPGICRFRVNVCRQRGSFAIVDIYDKYVAGYIQGSLEAQYTLAPLRIAFNLGPSPP